AMEVSSHALALGRADAIRFAVGLFTNLTQDHLDFHATMEDYFQAKRRLFLPTGGERWTPPRTAVLNVDDPYGRRIGDELHAAGHQPVTFAIDREADYRAIELESGLAGSS